jgi:hypothetical protein
MNDPPAALVEFAGGRESRLCQVGYERSTSLRVMAFRSALLL